MSINFSQREPSPIEHLLHKKKMPRAHLSSRGIYLRKKNSRLNREANIKLDEEKAAFFNWIEEIQSKLRLSNAAFAARIGVSTQTVKVWKRRIGHYPSQANLKMLKILEKEARIEILDIKFIVRIKG